MAAKKKTSIQPPTDKPTKGRSRKAVSNEKPRAAPPEPPVAEPLSIPTLEPAPTGTATSTQGEKVSATRSSPGEPGQQPSRSALEAAVQVLRETGQALTCRELITWMAAQGYWRSPKGKTPASTLYSSLLREIQTKGERARFVKIARGKFALRAAL
jgi:hypothetical protein